MAKWNLKYKTRIKKIKSESKDVAIKFDDLLKRNYNPKHDNIIASDLSYIPANEERRNVYLSVA